MYCIQINNILFNTLIATVGMSSSLFYYLIRSYLTPHSDSSVMFADCNINKIKTSLQAQILIGYISLAKMWLLYLISSL